MPAAGPACFRLVEVGSGGRGERWVVVGAAKKTTRT